MEVLTGYRELDDMLGGGLKGGSVYVLGSRPCMGKTGITLNIIDHISTNDKKSVAYFSLEMSKTALVERLMILKTNVTSMKVRSGDLNSEDWQRIVKATEIISDSQLIIDDTAAISVEELREKCSEYMKNGNLSAIVIDYLQLMTASDSFVSRREELSEIIKGLKALAEDLNLPILALAQLSRAPEQRDDHRPILSDIRESKDIVNYSDVVMFIYRDYYYNINSDKKNIAEIIVAKNLLGKCGTCELNYNPDTIRFDNID